MVAESPCARFNPLLGRPMLSRIVTSSSLGISRLIVFSILVKYRSVSSTRVPVGVRTCSRSCPASTRGKKSLPRKGSTHALAAMRTSIRVRVVRFERSVHSRTRT